jgi:transcriptional regulator with XRE-family HTH domain
VDRDELADFLRHRREALRPEDVGLSEGPRRRTKGLRREEVAALAAMSTDYYARLEQRRGPQPSIEILASLARALRLTRDERDHLFRLAGRTPPANLFRATHVDPALMRVLDRIDTPAQIVSDVGETLVQNPAAVALLGDQTGYEGPARSLVYRWFTDPEERRLYPADDWDLHARSHVAALRLAQAREDSEDVAELVDLLTDASEEFAQLWAEHDVRLRLGEQSKRFAHAEVGLIELRCQPLIAENQAQALLVYTATPGSEDDEKLQLLSVIGTQKLDSA